MLRLWYVGARLIITNSQDAITDPLEIEMLIDRSPAQRPVDIGILDLLDHTPLALRYRL
ncbi:hypothetical protein D3C78_1896340 [compost metagenome]